jgi:hypothetical protein
MFSAAASPHTGPSRIGLRKSINVIALDELGTNGVVWTLQDAMPIRYELSPMESTRSDVLTESVTFAIQGVDRSLSFMRFLKEVLSKL